MGTIAEKDKRTTYKMIGWLIIPIIIVAVIAFIYLNTKPTDDSQEIDYRTFSIKFDQEKIEDGWLIKITRAHRPGTENNSGFPLSELTYSFENNSAGPIEEINGKFNEIETVIFFDNNNDNLLNTGDTFFIYDNPGRDVEPGLYFRISWLYFGTGFFLN